MIEGIVALTAAVVVVLGAAFALVAAVGIVRLPDVLTRMHGSTKAGTLGGGLILIAAALVLQDEVTVLRVIAILGFLILTAPVAAHLIGRAAYRTGVPLWDRMVVDELAEAEKRAKAPD